MIFQPIEIEEVIDKEYQEKIFNLVTDVKFPWHFLQDTTFERNVPGNSTPSFVNLIYHPNNEINPYLEFFFPLLQTSLDKAGYQLNELLRIRLGFLLNTRYTFAGSPYQYNNPHRDFEQDHFVGIYYVNTCDGPTVIFHDIQPAEKYKPMHRSEPKQGKFLMFNGWHYHASTCPKVFNKRIVLTMNFTASKKNG